MKKEEQFAIQLYEYAEENAMIQPIDFKIYNHKKNQFSDLDMSQFVLINAKLFHSNYFNRLVFYLLADPDQLIFKELHVWQLLLTSSDKGVVKKAIDFLTRYIDIDALNFVCTLLHIPSSFKLELIAEYLDFVSPLVLNTMDEEELIEIERECHITEKLKSIQALFLENGAELFELDSCVEKWSALKNQLNSTNPPPMPNGK